MFSRTSLYYRITSLLFIALAVFISGCGGGGAGSDPPSTILSDTFTSLSSSLWTVQADVKTVDSSLVLSGLTNDAAIQTGASYGYGYLSFTALSDSWGTGIDAGLQKDNDHILLRNGNLIISNGGQAASVPITNWNTLKSSRHQYVINWSAGTVSLLVDGAASASYSGAAVPVGQMHVYFAAQAGVLQVDYTDVGAASSSLFNDTFNSLSASDWTVVDGSLATVRNGNLVLQSVVGSSAQAISKTEFTYKNIQVLATSDWAVGTSIGLVGSGGSSNWTVTAGNGQYTVTSPGGSSTGNITQWSNISSQESVFRFKWYNGGSQLLVDGFLKSTYSGSYLLTQPGQVRLIASDQAVSELVVDSVTVQDSL